jgi:putative spermidine/putrescine transport system permease protein
MKKTLLFPAILLAFIFGFPLLFLLLLSFGQQWPYPSILPLHWSEETWQKIAWEKRIGNGLGLSLLISLSVGSIASILSLLLAKAVAYSPNQRWWLGGAYLLYLVSPVVLAASWQFYFLRLGWAGQPLGVWLAQFFITLPFGVIFFNSFWNEQQRSLEHLVATLGGTPWQTFWRVSFPLARGPLLICFFQSFLISWFEYGLTALIGVGKVQTLPLMVYQFIGEANIFYAALASCLLLIPPLLLLWFNRRFVFIER